MTPLQQEGKRRELAESFAMRKVMRGRGGRGSDVAAPVVSQAERWRAKAVAKVKTRPTHTCTIASSAITSRVTLVMRYTSRVTRHTSQVMESQGQLPQQGGGGPWAGGADDEFGPLLQVACDMWHVTRHVSRVMCNSFPLQPLLPRPRRDSYDRPGNRAAAAAAAVASISAAVAAAHAQQITEPRTEGNASSSSSSSRWLPARQSTRTAADSLPPPPPSLSQLPVHFKHTGVVGGRVMWHVSRVTCHVCLHTHACARCSARQANFKFTFNNSRPPTTSQHFTLTHPQASSSRASHVTCTAP